MSKIKSLVNETIIYGIGSMLPKIINFIFIASYLTRVIEKESYGIYGIMYSYSSLLIAIYTFRMETTFFRYGKKSEDRGKVFYNISLIVLSITIVFSLLIGFNSEYIASILTRPEDSKYVLYFLFIVAFDALSAVPFAKLRLENRAKTFAILKLVNVLIIAGIVAFFLGLLPYFSEQNIEWATTLYSPNKELDYVFLSNLVASAVILLFLAKEYRSIVPKYDPALISKMAKYAAPLFIVALAGVISTQLDRFLIKEWSSSDFILALEYSGVYNAVIKIAVLMSIFTMAFNYAAEPFFFKNSEEGKTTKLYGSIALAYTMAACVLFLIISMFLDQFQYLIGIDFRTGIGVVPLLTMGFLILGIFYNFSIWYKLADKTKYGAGIAVFGAVVSLVANYFLIPVYNIYGAALAAIISYSSMCALTYYIGQHIYPIHYPIVKIISYTGLAALFYLGFHYTKSELTPFPSIIMAIVLLLLYIGICYFAERKNFKEVLAL